MTNSSDETTSDLHEATAKFVALENYAARVQSFKKRWRRSDHSDISRLLVMTTYPDQNMDLIQVIQHDSQHASRFGALLRSMAVFSQHKPQQPVTTWQADWRAIWSRTKTIITSGRCLFPIIRMHLVKQFRSIFITVTIIAIIFSTHLSVTAYHKLWLVKVTR